MQPADSLQARKAPSRPETVLVAEDNEYLRGLIRRVLCSCGYAVLEAADGPRAVQLCREHPGDIHLLIADVVMPQMSGPALATRARAVRPGLKVLFLSGHTDSVVERYGPAAEDFRLLSKPFNLEQLTTMVREAIGA